MIQDVSRDAEGEFQALGGQHNKPDVVSRLRSGSVVITTLQDESWFYLSWSPLTLNIRIRKDSHVVQVLLCGEGVRAFLPWLLIGQVLGFVMHTRGQLCMHASCVSNGKRTIGLMGSRRSGKSTLTAYLIKEGWELVSEDVLCIADFEALSVAPFLPFIKLSDDSLELLGLTHIGSSSVPVTNKKIVPVDGTWGGGFYCTEAPRLSALYLVRRMPPSSRAWINEARVESLNRHLGRAVCVGNGFHTQLLGGRQQICFRKAVERLADRVPVEKVKFGSGVGALMRVERLLCQV